MAQEKVKLTDLQVADDLMEIIQNEVRNLKTESSLDVAAVMKLEKLTRAYGLLMANLRENLKQKVFGSLDLSEEFQEVVEGAETPAGRDEGDQDLGQELEDLE